MFRFDRATFALAIALLWLPPLQAQQNGGAPPTSKTDETSRMADIPYTSQTKITVERRGQIVLDNRIDPEAMEGLGKAYYDYDRDPSLRAAVLFGYGERFSRGIDVGANRRTGPPAVSAPDAAELHRLRQAHREARARGHPQAARTQAGERNGDRRSE
jgi:hypothetical protein